VNAPATCWYERLLFGAAFQKLMARAQGLPAPWTIDLVDGELRPLERAVFEHGIDGDHVAPITSFVDWPADWRLPLSLILTSGDEDIVVVETEELSAQ
jgi:hypothetical protein